MNEQPDERRRCQRYELNLTMKLAGQVATTDNVSSTGLYAISNERIEPGTDVDLEVFFPSLGPGTNRLAGMARVMRTLVEPDGRFGIGLKLTSWQFA